MMTDILLALSSLILILTLTMSPLSSLRLSLSLSQLRLYLLSFIYNLLCIVMSAYKDNTNSALLVAITEPSSRRKSAKFSDAYVGLHVNTNNSHIWGDLCSKKYQGQDWDGCREEGYVATNSAQARDSVLALCPCTWSEAWVGSQARIFGITSRNYFRRLPNSF